MAAVGTDDELLEGAWDQLEGQFRRVGGSAQKRALGYAGRIVGGFTPEQRASLGLRQAGDLDTAWSWMKENLTALAKARLYAPDPNDPGLGEFDPTSQAPTGLIRQAMRVAGGTTGAANLTEISTNDLGSAWITTPDAGAPGGIATGALIEQIIRDEGGSVQGYRWVYGPADRTRPFLPHLRLDGMVFASFTDPRLAIPGSFPTTGHYIPGDHRGCICDVEPIVLTPAQVRELGVQPPTPPPQPPPQVEQPPPPPPPPPQAKAARKAKVDKTIARPADRPQVAEHVVQRYTNPLDHAYRMRQSHIETWDTYERMRPNAQAKIAKLNDDWSKATSEEERNRISRALRDERSNVDYIDSGQRRAVKGVKDIDARLPGLEAEYAKAVDEALAIRTTTHQYLDDLELHGRHVRTMVDHGELKVRVGSAEARALGRSPQNIKADIQGEMYGLDEIDDRALALVRAANLKIDYTDGPLKTIPELSDLTGIVQGETMGTPRRWEEVGGVQRGSYNLSPENVRSGPHIGMAPVVGRGHSVGTIIAHEVGHAVDTATAYGRVLNGVKVPGSKRTVDQWIDTRARSQSDIRWQTLWNKIIKDSPAMSDYYKPSGHSGNPIKGWSEGFAEAFSAYSSGGSKKVTQRRLYRMFGLRAEDAPANAEAVISYFDDLLDSMGVPPASDPTLPAKLKRIPKDTAHMQRLADVAAEAAA